MTVSTDAVGVPVDILSLRDVAAGWTVSDQYSLDDVTIEVGAFGGDVWASVTLPTGTHLWLRLLAGWSASVELTTLRSDGGVRIVSSTEAFEGSCLIELLETGLLRWTTSLRPNSDLRLSDHPRDVYWASREGEPSAGKLIVSQFELNSGVFLAQLDEPATSALYFQDFTPLAPFFELCGTDPKKTVGGYWPETGYRPPVTADKVLPAHQDVLISRAYLAWSEGALETPRAAAKAYIELLARVYVHLNHPETKLRNWLERSQLTLRHLATSPLLLRRDYGQLYLRPYVDAEVPDSMVQLTLINALEEFGLWRRRKVPLADKLQEGLSRFFDPELGTIRRFLPNVGEQKDRNEVDSWYLYHPLLHLVSMVKRCHEEYRDVLLRAVEFGIKAAHHFRYEWPVKFDLRSFEVMQREREPGEPGQSDVGGLYAHLMVSTYELTEDERYLDEAWAALEALSGRGFDLLYQSNLTAWGAVGCLRLYDHRRKPELLEQSLVFLANILHSSALWESKIGHARHYPTFMAINCLHDGPYFAPYECFECFMALREYLLHADRLGLDGSVSLLLTESNRYALDRAMFFFPDMLPDEALAKQQRNGRIERKLSIPLEDLYIDGQPAGQVGQETYGAFGAFQICVRAHEPLQHFGAFLSTDYPAVVMNETPNEVHFRLIGDPRFKSSVRFMPHKQPIEVLEWNGAKLHPNVEGFVEIQVEGGSELTVRRL